MRTLETEVKLNRACPRPRVSLGLRLPEEGDKFGDRWGELLPILLLGPASSSGTSSMLGLRESERSRKDEDEEIGGWEWPVRYENNVLKSG